MNRNGSNPPPPKGGRPNPPPNPPNPARDSADYEREIGALKHQLAEMIDWSRRWRESSEFYSSFAYHVIHKASPNSSNEFKQASREECQAYMGRS